MTHYDYTRSLELSQEPFYALIMAAMRKADTKNSFALTMAFPATYKELEERYNAPGGYLAGERHED